MKNNRIETLPTEGSDVKLKITSVTYETPFPNVGGKAPSDVVYEEGESDFPVDIEDAALRCLSAEADDDGPLRTEFVTVGKYADEGGRITITYDESEILQTPGTLSQITFRKDEPGLVAIVRTGAIKSMFVLEAGRRHVSEYDMGFIKIPMCFCATRVVNTVKDGAGFIELIYRVEMNGSQTQRTKMKITLG